MALLATRKVAERKRTWLKVNLSTSTSGEPQLAKLFASLQVSIEEQSASWLSLLMENFFSQSVKTTKTLSLSMTGLLRP